MIGRRQWHSANQLLRIDFGIFARGLQNTRAIKSPRAAGRIDAQISWDLRDRGRGVRFEEARLVQEGQLVEEDQRGNWRKLG